MKYFKEGLTKDELKKAYRQLVKEYHPDLHHGEEDKYNEIMKELNDEYDKYYTSVNSSVFSPYDYWKSYQDAKRSRERIILFMFRNKRKDEYHDYDFYGTKGVTGYDTIYYNYGETWNGFRTGLAYVEVIEEDFMSAKVAKLPASFEMPTYRDLVQLHIGDLKGYYTDFDWTFRQHGEVVHFNTQFGEFVAEDFDNIRFGCKLIVKMNGRPSYVKVNKNFLGPIEIIQRTTLADIIFEEFTGYTFEEFKERYDVDYNPQFTHAVQMQKTDGSFSQSPTVGYFARKGIINIYQSRMNHKLKYGTFNLGALTRSLDHLDMEDIDEVQDYLDEINKDFDESIRRMIKKGKIRVNV